MKVSGATGRPNLGVTVGGPLSGNVELKVLPNEAVQVDPPGEEVDAAGVEFGEHRLSGVA